MAKKTHTGLGKGLGALLTSSFEVSGTGLKFTPSPDNSDAPISVSDGNSQPATPQIKVNEIVHNPYQPRKEFDSDALEDLKNSILEFGVIQPITVRPSLNGYELISGERRLRASILAGLDTIPAHIINVTEDVEMMAMALIENVQRHDLNPIEIANGYNQLIEDCNLTQEEVAKKVGKDRSTITNSLRLLKLPEKIQDSLRNLEISTGHARAMLALSSTQKMLLAWQEVMDKGLSVRATEKLVRDIEEGKFVSDLDSPSLPKKPRLAKWDKANVPPEVATVLEARENSLRHIFGTQIRINPKDEKSGKIEIEFYSPDDLERILDMLANSKENNIETNI